MSIAPSLLPLLVTGGLAEHAVVCNGCGALVLNNLNAMNAHRDWHLVHDGGLTMNEQSQEERRSALHAIYWLADDAQRVLAAGDVAEVRRTLRMIRDAVLRGLGDEKP